MNQQQRAVVQQALEALESCDFVYTYGNGGYQQFDRLAVDKAIPALTQLLEQQPVQEPVAWQVHPFDYGVGLDGVYARTDRLEQVEAWKRKGWTVQPLYTPPPAQPAAWVELTDEDYPDADNPYCCVNSDFIEGAKWASAKLREKNGGKV